MILTMLAVAAVSYPDTKTSDLVETLHGTEVPDPFRWLEDDNSEATKAWVKAQNQVTDAYLDSLPTRDEIHTRVSKLLNFERIGRPQRFGERWFFSHIGLSL